jgi:hypothetical protein
MAMAAIGHRGCRPATISLAISPKFADNLIMSIRRPTDDMRAEIRAHGVRAGYRVGPANPIIRFML